MDTARCHLTEEVKKTIKKMGSEVKYIPDGMNPLLQPLNTHLNKPLKGFLRKKWNDWMLEGEHVSTMFINLKIVIIEYKLFKNLMKPLKVILIISGIHQIGQEEESIL